MWLWVLVDRPVLMLVLLHAAAPDSPDDIHRHDQHDYRDQPRHEEIRHLHRRRLIHGVLLGRYTKVTGAFGRAFPSKFFIEIIPG